MPDFVPVVKPFAGQVQVILPDTGDSASNSKGQLKVSIYVPDILTETVNLKHSYITIAYFYLCEKNIFLKSTKTC